LLNGAELGTDDGEPKVAGTSSVSKFITSISPVRLSFVILFIATARAEKNEIQPDLLSVIVDEIGLASRVPLVRACGSGEGETEGAT
jgi:hypothetical protein